MLSRDGRVVLRPSELENCIRFFYAQTGEHGSKKLSYRVRSHYYGVSEGVILSTLKKIAHTLNTATISKKIPLCSLERNVMERHLVELVTMTAYPARKPGGKAFKYILSVFDTFSRFLWLCPVRNNKSQTIAHELTDIYRQFGPPKFVHCDNGSELKGAFQSVCAALHVVITRNPPHHPQSQGKMERPPQSWKKHLLRQLQGNRSLDWTDYVSKLEMAYNNHYHRAIGMSPYECMFGISSAFVAGSFEGGLFVYSDGDDDDGDENNVSDGNGSDFNDVEISPTVCNDNGIDNVGDCGTDNFDNCSVDSAADRVRHFDVVGRKAECHNVRCSRCISNHQLVTHLDVVGRKAECHNVRCSRCISNHQLVTHLDVVGRKAECHNVRCSRCISNHQLVTHLDVVGRKAECHNVRCSRCIINHQLRSNPPSVYAPGDNVIVKLRCEKENRLSRKRWKLHTGVVAAKLGDFTYQVQISAGLRTGEHVLVDVTRMTSETRAEEKMKQQQARDAIDISMQTTLYFSKMNSRNKAISRDSSFDALIETAAQYNLEIESDNEGGGDCMFISLEQQFQQNGVFITHREIRRRIVAYLAKHRQIQSGNGDIVSLSDFVTNYASWEDYLEDLSQDGVWGDHLALIAAANEFQISIWVLSNIPNSDPVFIEPANAEATVATVYLGHLSEIHYVSLQHMVTLCEVCGNSSNSCDCHKSWSQGFPNQTKTLCETCGETATPCSCSANHSGNCGIIQRTAITCDHCPVSTEYCQCYEDSQKDETQQSDDPEFSSGKSPEDKLREKLSQTPPPCDFPTNNTGQDVRQTILSKLISDFKGYLQALLAYDFSNYDRDTISPVTFKDEPHSVGVFRYLLEELGFSMRTVCLGGELVITLSAALLTVFKQFKTFLEKNSKSYRLIVLYPKCREILKDMGFRFESDCTYYALLSHSEFDEFWARFSQDRTSDD